MRDNIRMGLLVFGVICLAIIAERSTALDVTLLDKLHNMLQIIERNTATLTSQDRGTATAERREEGRLLASGGRFEEAIAAYQTALEIDPADRDARQGAEISAVLWMAREPDRAKIDPSRVRYFATRYQATPVSGITAAEATLALGNLAFYADGDLEGAGALYNQILAADRSDFYARVAIANILLQRSKKGPVEGVLEELLPDAEGLKVSRMAAETIARLALSNKQYPVAEKFAALAGAERRTPGNLMLLAQAHLGNKQYDQATAAAEQVVALAPKEATGFQLLCQAHVQSEKYGQAVGSCAAAFERAKDPADQLMLARALARTGRDREAVEAYQAALQRDDRQLGAYLEVGNLFRRLGDLRGAAWAFGRLANLAPSTPGAQLPPEIEKLRDDARAQLQSMGPIPAGGDDAPGARKPKR